MCKPFQNRSLYNFKMNQMKNLLTTLALVLFITSAILGQGLEVNQGTTLSNSNTKNGYAIIGDEGGLNITFDNNEIQQKNGNAPGGNFFINSRAGNTIFATEPNSGNVYIGALTGNTKFTVTVDGNDGIGIVGDNTGTAGYRLTNGNGNHYLFDDPNDENALNLQSASEMAFNYDGSNEAMRIKSDGDLYIGHNIIGGFDTRVSIYTDENLLGTSILNEKENSNPIGLLVTTNGDGTGNRTGVSGIANGTATGLIIGVNGMANSITGSNAYGVRGEVIGNSDGINRYAVYGTAPINSGESWAIYGNGDLYYTGSFTAPSDARLKSNIQQAPDLLSKVMQLKVKTYDYNTAAFPHIHLSQGKQFGFIAQELNTIFPEVVKEQHHTFVSKDNPEEVIEEDLLGVEYMELIPILTKALQEQQVQIEALKAEVAALKK